MRNIFANNNASSLNRVSIVHCLQSCSLGQSIQALTNSLNLLSEYNSFESFKHHRLTFFHLN